MRFFYFAAPDIDILHYFSYNSRFFIVLLYLDLGQAK